MRATVWVFVMGVLLCCCSMDLSAQFRRKIKKPKPSSNFTIEQLAPGVWVAISNDYYGKAICNAGIVDLGDRTLVFDPFLTPSVARELKAFARYLTKKQVSFVVNSNYRNDHIRGTQVFLPNASVISTSITRKEIERIEPEEQEWERKHAPTLLQAVKKRMTNASTTEKEELPFWVGYYQGMVESVDELFTATPDMIFDDSLWLTGTKLSVKLVERRSGNTSSDAVMLIPSLGIAFMSDLLSNERHPWISDGSVEGWQESLKLFYEDTLYHTYVPGHGKVCGKEPLRTLYEYLEDIKTLCESVKTDSAEIALMHQPIPQPYRSWFCGRFYQPNLQFIINSTRQRSEENSLRVRQY
ncbi:MAG: MBL fold metallo-hydrolase [Chitinophagaceae bacterium]|nr:MBL fold metallo-hydrolase [Chitinophagaceae bacterium]